MNESPPCSEPEVLEGTIKSVVFHNDETGYTVLRLELPREFELHAPREAVVVGKTQTAWEGEDVRAEGRWITDKEYGREFKAEKILCIAPKSILGIERYLASGLIKGIGKVLAKRIVKTFGEDTLNVLSHQSARLAEVPKLGTAKIKQIREAWHANESMRETMIFGQTYGISVARMARIVRKYGPDAIAVIKADPYQLCRDIWGIGFATADKIALNIGIAKDSPLRARASISFTLEKEAEDGGHCWTLENDLLMRASELTGIAIETLAEALQAEIVDARIVAVAQNAAPAAAAVDASATGKNAPGGAAAAGEGAGGKEGFWAVGRGEPRRIYLRSLYRAEQNAASCIRAILRTPAAFRPIDARRAVEWWEKRSGFSLANKQADALENCLSNKFSIITGGPGVGKTTIIRALVDIFAARSLAIVLAAPTGRAAKRMSESVGFPAQTIHRLLKWNPATNRFTYDAENPLAGDVFIFDETSMIDIRLAADLLCALPRKACVIWVGDTDQLPSVGPGSVLGDMIASRAVACTRLDEIFRQKGTGLIVVNAHHVNSGEPLETSHAEDSDFFFARVGDPAECVRRAIEFMKTRIPRKFNLKPLEDVQVLVPMRKNILGADNLNFEIQRALNPAGPAVERGGTVFRVGDRVMQLRNNYDKDVFNGDIGFVKDADPAERTLVVVFDGRPVRYEAADLDELVLAYATTIHKSQGSEYPAVIVIIHSQHYVMLQRNLLYTAITRGRKLVLLMGVPYAVERAIATNTVRERRTSLADLLAAPR